MNGIREKRAVKVPLSRRWHLTSGGSRTLCGLTAVSADKRALAHTVQEAARCAACSGGDWNDPEVTRA